MPLTDLPVEVLDTCLVFVASASDLSSLALTCKRLHGVIVPDHLHWRSVCISADDMVAFNQLVHNDRLAGHVQRLKIVEETWMKGGRGYSRAISPTQRKKGEWQLISSVPFKLRKVESVALDVEVLGNFTDFLGNLRVARPELREFSCWNRTADVDDDDMIEAIEELGGYKTFSWQCDPIEQTLFSPLIHMLSTHCEELECLDLHFETHHCDTSSFWECRWPRLRSLRMREEFRVGTTAEVASFLEAHVLLEVLCMHSLNWPRLTLPSTALPRIRELDTPFATPVVAEVIKPLSNGQRRPLTFLHLAPQTEAGHNVDPKSPLVFGPSVTVTTFCKNLAAMRTLEVFHWNDTARFLPGSYALALCGMSLPTVHTVILSIATVMRRAGEGPWEALFRALSEFKALRKLEIKERLWAAPTLTWESTVKSLASCCPLLERVNTWVKNSDGSWSESR